MSEEGCYRTDDLALATMLAMEGFEYSIKKLSSKKAIWIFTFSHEMEEDFEDLIADYDQYAAKVEPRAFVLRWGEMRRELFHYCPPTRRSVAPSTAS
jgi:hypothetical protein